MSLTTSSPSGTATATTTPSDALTRDLAAHLRARYPLIHITTWEEHRALTLIERAVATTGHTLDTWSSTDTASSPAAPTELHNLLTRFARAEKPGVLVLKDFAPFIAPNGPSTAATARLLRDLLPEFAKHQHALLFVGPTIAVPVELEKEIALLDLPLPHFDDLYAVFNTVVTEEKRFAPPQLAEALVRAALGLSTREAERVFRKTCAAADDTLTAAHIDLVIEDKKRLLRQSDLLEFFHPDAGLDDIGGLDELKRWLREREKGFSQDAAAFGLAPPKGLLLIGVQGCGKSLTAKAVASLWRFPLLRLDLAAAFGPSKGPEEALRRAIKVSESLAPCVLWIDEIEKGFAGVAGDHADIDAARAFGAFITWLQEKRSPVFVVATANDVTGLPPELLRKGRFDEIFFIDLPDVHERERIFAIHLTRRGRGNLPLPVKQLAAASEHYSGAEIEQVVAAAMFRAFAKRRDVTGEDLEAGLAETVPLYTTYEERIKAMRDWARHRARFASHDVTVLDFFRKP